MTIRRRDRGLSGDDMGCDGSRVSGDDLLERLRGVPGAAPVFDALADVPGVWVVGGAVRDALLGHGPRDLDLVVEGDAEAVARRLGEDPLVHDRFGTATAVGEVNIAATRRERYARPGALPDVELGVPLREDLERRDFSVNTLAVRLADGELESVPGALEDLAGRRLRALHARSFLDDPTRLLRLVRYGARLRFQIEQETRLWAFAAVADGALATVTGPRLGAELRLLLRSPSRRRCAAWRGCGSARALLPGFRVDPDLVERAQRLIPDDGGPTSSRWPPAASTRARPSSPSASTGSSSPPASATSSSPRPPAPARCARDGRDGQRVGAVGAAAARGARDGRAGRRLGAREAARKWLEELRGVRLAIDGDDLVAAGLSGPAVGRALDAAMGAALDGEAGDREAQLAVALQAE